MIVLADVGTLSPELRDRLTLGSNMAACWCGSQARAWRRPTTIWCR